MRIEFQKAVVAAAEGAVNDIIELQGKRIERLQELCGYAAMAIRRDDYSESLLDQLDDAAEGRL